MFDHQAHKLRPSESLCIYFILYIISFLCCWAERLKRQRSGKATIFYFSHISPLESSEDGKEQQFQSEFLMSASTDNGSTAR